mgnify:CR=1 FL=1|tara:strand:- start:46 stop:426 length:381 start_codon:yes stop_codon:yes gene_type:complete
MRTTFLLLPFPEHISLGEYNNHREVEMLTKKEIQFIAKNYKDYKSPMYACKSMPAVLEHVRCLEAKIERLKKAPSKVTAKVGIMEVVVDTGKDGLLGTKDDKISVGIAKKKAPAKKKKAKAAKKKK